MFALVDCNNFFASCERLFRPDLNDKPVVVLSNNDGCVVARSNEAKAIGIPMGAPAFQYEKLFQDYKVQVFSANFPLYGDISNRVMSILSEYSPEIEVYSIDEIFLKLQGFEHFNLQDYGEQMLKKVITWVGIPISVGIAPTKSLAKVANKIAKKFQAKTGGVYIIDTEEKRLKALKWLKVEDVWGIGRQHSKRLKLMNIHTAYDFTRLEDSWIKRNLSIVELRLKKDLLGIAALDLEKARDKKSIATTRTFDKNYDDFDYIQERISTFAVSCAAKLRLQNCSCNTITVFIRTNNHRDDMQQYNRSISMKLPYPTNSNIELSKFATTAFKTIFKDNFKYKKAGVIVSDIVPDASRQLSVFENSNHLHKPLMLAIDKMNNMFGQHKVRLGSQDSRTWKMRQERLSPMYTTRLGDIITVKS